MASAFDPFFVLDAGMVVSACNRAFLELACVEEGAAIGRPIEDVLPGVRGVWPRDAIADACSRKRGVVLRVDRSAGHLPLELRVYPSERGASVLALPVADPAPARPNVHAALEEKDTLLREVHHRVRNNLQLVASMLRLQFAHVRDQDLLRRIVSVQMRVDAIAMVHDMLDRRPSSTHLEAAAYLRDLVEGIMLVHDRGGLRSRIDVAPVDLPFEAALRVGLIVAELTWNALEHGFAGREAGTLRVTLTKEARELVLEVEDDGVGLEHALGRDGRFGIPLVHSLARQLGGTLTVVGPSVERREGTKFTIRFPEPRS